jgi:hypothetical protein
MALKLSRDGYSGRPVAKAWLLSCRQLNAMILDDYIDTLPLRVIRWLQEREGSYFGRMATVNIVPTGSPLPYLVNSTLQC